MKKVWVIALIIAAKLDELVLGMPGPGGGGPPGPPGGGKPPCWAPPCVPIDSGLWILIIAAIAIGFFFLKKRRRSTTSDG